MTRLDLPRLLVHGALKRLELHPELPVLAFQQHHAAALGREVRGHAAQRAADPLHAHLAHLVEPLTPHSSWAREPAPISAGSPHHFPPPASAPHPNRVMLGRDDGVAWWN